MSGGSLKMVQANFHVGQKRTWAYILQVFITTHGSPIGSRWVWIAKASNLQGQRYPTSRLGIQKFGHLALRVRRLDPPPPLHRSFVEVVQEHAMARRQQGPWKRRQEDWMEVDDLLDGDLHQEQDLR